MEKVSLCYNKKSDTLYISDSALTEETLFESYDDKGLYHDKPEFIIPGTTFSVKIKSNFEYGNASYLRAYIIYNNKPLFDFYNWSKVLQPNKYLRFEVVPNAQNWKYLFQKIIDVYNARNDWNYNAITEGLNALQLMLMDPNSVKIRRFVWSNDVIWNDAVSILHIARKIEELIDALEIIKDNCEVHNIDDAIVDACVKIIPLISSAYIKWYETQDQRMRYFEKIFSIIYKYLQSRSKAFVVFQYICDNNRL